MQPRGLIVIPAFNEEGMIAHVVAAATVQTGFDVLVVDDGSSDRTAERARGAGAGVVTHPFNLGYGCALQTGYRYAHRHGYEVVVQIDADGQHDPADAARLADPILRGEADIVVGCRFFSGSSYTMPPLRRLGVQWLRFLLRSLSGIDLRDPTSGLQALSASVVRLYTSEAFPSDYPDADMFVLLQKAGYRIRELEVRMKERNDARSMHAGIGVLYYSYKMTLAMIMNVLRPAQRP